MSQSPPRAPGVRRSYWVRWTLGVMAVGLVPLSILALAVSLFAPTLVPFATLAGVGVLVLAGFALLYSPAVIDPPYEERLRMEEWVAAATLPPER